MRKTFIIFTVIVAGCSTLSARNIVGKVVAEDDSTAVVGAICELKVKNSVIAKTVTDNNGAFAIDVKSKAGAGLVVSMTGFSHTDILIPEGSKNIDLGTLYLSSNTQLGEVTVSATHVMDGKDGRTIVIPSALDVKASESTLSLFDKLPLPGLNTNKMTRTISVDGGSPVILINGVPSNDNEVNALQPKNIARVEYSRITPARYIDKGNSGYINIILKQRNDGGSVSAWLRDCPTTGFLDANVNATYHQGRSQFSLLYVPSWRDYNKVYDNITESYIGSDFVEEMAVCDRNPFNYFSNQLQAKYDYRPSNATLFSATLRLYSNSNNSIRYGTYTDSYLGGYDMDNQRSDKELTPSLDLFLRHEFNDKNSIEAQVVGTLTSDDFNRFNKFTYPDGSIDSYLNDVKNRRRSLITEISYNHTFTPRTTLSLGAQNTLSHTTNEYTTTDYKPLLTENNNYVYAQLGQSFNRVYVSLSSGVKLFWMKNDMNKRNFVRNISTAQISWRVSDKWNIRGSFRYAPSIPSLSALTDYAQQSTQTLLSNGNPNLKTTETLMYQISPSFNCKKLSVSLSVSYNDSKNPWVNRIIYMGNKMFLNQSNNYDYQRNLYNKLSINVSEIFAGFGAKVDLYLSRFWAAGSDWSKNLTSFDAEFSLWWNRGPFTVNYWRNFPGKYLSGYNVGRQENTDGLTLVYQPNKHWIVSAAWWYMFDKKGTKYAQWSYDPVHPSYNERNINNNGNMFVLSMSYTTDFGTIFNTGRRGLNNSDSGSSLFKN